MIKGIERNDIMNELTLVINQPVEGKFLQSIGWNKQEIMDTVTSITEKYTGVQYTDEQMAIAKKDRASLNALKTAISNRRIEVKKALLAPYDVFESEVKEVVALIDKPISMIDEQTVAYENRLKAEKQQILVDYFNENVGELAQQLTFDMIFNPKWLNKTSSLKFCKDEIISVIKKVKTDLESINTLIDEKYRAYANDYYFRNNRAINAVLVEVRRMKEIDRKAEEERLKREQEIVLESDVTITQAEIDNEQQKQQNEPMPDEFTRQTESQQASASATVTEAYANRDTDTKIYKASFTIRGTKAQIYAVREFMLNNNIQFGKVEK